MPRYITIRNDKMRKPQPEWDSGANGDAGKEMQHNLSDAWMAGRMTQQTNREDAPEGNAFQAPATNGNAFQAAEPMDAE